MDSKRQYIVETARKSQHKNGFRIENVKILISSNPSFDVQDFFKNAAKKIPQELFNAADTIYVGKFIKPSSSLSAKTFNDVIFLNNSEDIKEMFSSLLHELSHCYQQKFHEEVFGDALLEKEFLNKRKKLFHKLTSHGIPTLPYPYFEATSYDKDFDSYLYNQIGYDDLRYIISGIFPTCYSVTSLGEYFSVGTECFLTGKENMLIDCPILQKKVNKL